MNFTKGEWKIAGPANIDGAPDYAITVDGQIIAEAFGRSDEDKFHNSLANAHLISAAPELLSALKRILAADDDLANEGDAETLSSAIKAAHAAIQKAEGKKS